MTGREQSRGRGRRFAALTAGAVGFAVAGAVIASAALAVFTPPRDVLADTAFTTVKLVTGHVSSAITMSTVAEWKASPVGANQASGVVTSVTAKSGDIVTAGQTLYTVNLRPVVVAAGSIPSFRAMSRGIAGADVTQLQGFLAATGFYGGAQDGQFGYATERAVKNWQATLGVAQDGQVQAGDLLFIAALPARIVVDAEKIQRAASLSGGEQVVSALGAEPVFTLVATSVQAAEVPAGTQVEIRADDQTWKAVAGAQSPSPDNRDEIDIQLGGVDQGSICGGACQLVAVTGKSLLSTRVILQAPVSGIIAPVSALTSAADGSVAVIDIKGHRHPAQVVATAQGMSVITGVPAGLTVRIPAVDGKHGE